MNRERKTLSARLALIVLVAVAMIGSTVFTSFSGVSATGTAGLNPVPALFGDRDDDNGGRNGDRDRDDRRGDDDNDWGNDDGRGNDDNDWGNDDGRGNDDNDWGNDDDRGNDDNDWGNDDGRGNDDDDRDNDDRDPGECDNPEAFVTYLSNDVLPNLAVTNGAAIEAALLSAFNKCGDDRPDGCDEGASASTAGYALHHGCGEDPDRCDEEVASINGAVALKNKHRDKCDQTPTAEPTLEPTLAPTEEPTLAPTEEPTDAPTEEPTLEPTEEPTLEPTETATPPFDFVFDLDENGTGTVEIDFDLDGATDLIITLENGVIVDVDIVGVDEDPEDSATETAEAA